LLPRLRIRDITSDRFDLVKTSVIFSRPRIIKCRVRNAKCRIHNPRKP
jgi:hypothetical protein